MQLTEQIFSLVGTALGSGALASYFTYRSQKKTANADAADSIADSARQLVETMRVDLLQLKQDIALCRSENLILQKRVFELEAELKVYKTLGATQPNANVVPITNP